MSALKDHTVVIVGASSGIGLATARQAAAAGAKVVMISRSREKLEAAARTVEGNVVVAPADMLNVEELGGAIRSAGAIDHLVLTAVADEIPRIHPLVELSDEQMERSMDKLRGFFFAARAAVPAMRERGSITITSGASGLKATRGMSVLGAVAAAVTTFAHVLALELAPLRVNAITPGVVDTPIHQGEARERVRKWAESDLPARRFGEPEDIAQAILFLMTNPYMTGHDLVIDGGLTV
ncbi:MAG TPA: SDR family oxidoreductase [Polyangiaceae bacterium]|nr:SDR family oxidoreductase [Polyangiaceae bacterium]